MSPGDLPAGFAGQFAVPIPVHRRLTYWIPSHFAARAVLGARALLPVGKRKIVGFYLGRAGGSPPGEEGRKVKSIEGFIDQAPLFSEGMLEFLLQAAAYYRYPEGLALKAASGPGGVEAGKVHIAATPAGRAQAREGKLTEIEARVIQLTSASPKTGKQLMRFIPILSPEKLDEMQERGLVEETRRTAPSPQADERICLFLAGKKWDEAGLLITERQRDILEALSRNDGVTIAALRRSFPLVRRDIMDLRRGGYIRTEDVSAAACLTSLPPRQAEGGEFELNEPQRSACAALDRALARKRFETFLLFGITGSGKTEVYLRTIIQALKLGMSSVVIVPEIVLTPQLLDTFRRKIGENVAVIHSGLSPTARRKEMQDIAEGRKKVVVGARSALFSLVSGPGVFVVDEEHDSSLKQEEGFRYHARDMAILRARREGALAILSSATPSLESFYNAAKGKYSLLTLPERVSPNPLPDVQVIDSRRHIMGPLKQPYISMPLYHAISETLASGGQVIIFLNRRGYAPISVCSECGQSLRCPNCSVTLTYHLFTARLSCHHCGYSQGETTRCPACGAEGSIGIKGPGTERIEEVIRRLFPSASVVRMDSDVASGAASEPILRKLRDGRADILVGTQMITKGHDLPKVALVGVIRADAELNFPDFRAAEKTFSVLTQVAGRSGRGPLPGRVILQTLNPHHPAIEAATKQNYALFYGWEIRNRRALFYPPFSHLALIRLEGASAERIMERGERIVRTMKGAAPSAGGALQVLGPAPSPIEKIRKRLRYQILVKAETRGLLGEVVDEVIRAKQGESADVRMIVDIDPIDFM